MIWILVGVASCVCFLGGAVIGRSLLQRKLATALAVEHFIYDEIVPTIEELDDYTDRTHLYIQELQQVESLPAFLRRLRQHRRDRWCRRFLRAMLQQYQLQYFAYKYLFLRMNQFLHTSNVQKGGKL